MTPVIAIAQRDARAERQSSLARTLADDSIESVTRQRNACAAGQQPTLVEERRSAGFDAAPDAADFCVTLLTRLGRAGTLGFVSDAQGKTDTAALAFDRGFVAAYRKAQPVPADAPSMAAIKPIAERCLAQAEPDTDLCQAVGYAYGARAALGEIVIVR